MKVIGALVGVLALVSAGCSTQGLAFVEDTRVEIVSPEANEEVTLPLEIRWTVEDFDGRFLVLIDHHPMRPGRPLLSLVSEDDPCRRNPDCPNAEWLADHDIYLTDSTSLVVSSIPDRRPNTRTSDRHELVIVLLDDEGRRVGESAFVREFIVERED